MNFYRPKLRCFVAQCIADHIPTLQSAIFFLTEIKGVPAAICILHIAGTLVQLKKAFRQYIIEEMNFRNLKLHAAQKLLNTDPINEELNVIEELGNSE